MAVCSALDYSAEGRVFESHYFGHYKTLVEHTLFHYFFQYDTYLLFKIMPRSQDIPRRGVDNGAAGAAAAAPIIWLVVLYKNEGLFAALN